MASTKIAERTFYTFKTQQPCDNILKCNLILLIWTILRLSILLTLIVFLIWYNCYLLSITEIHNNVYLLLYMTVKNKDRTYIQRKTQVFTQRIIHFYIVTWEQYLIRQKNKLNTENDETNFAFIVGRKRWISPWITRLVMNHII
jgi:hypothetical protein